MTNKIKVSDFLEKYKEQLGSYYHTELESKKDKNSFIDSLSKIPNENLKVICKDFGVIIQKVIFDYQEAKDEIIKFIDEIDFDEDTNSNYDSTKTEIDDIEKFQFFLNNYSFREFDGNQIKTKAVMTFYNGLGVTHKDNFIIQINFNPGKYAFLVNGEKDVCGKFTINKQSDKRDEYYLTAFINDLIFNKMDNKYFYLFIYKYGIYYRIKLNVEIIQKLPIVNKILCIDFGTSNTTAGSFIDDISFIQFENNKNGNILYAPIIPSSVYIDDCYDENNIKYLFGYEANKINEEKNYNPEGSIFKSIKNWLKDLLKNFDETIEIFDSNGIRKNIKKHKIIHDYVMFILNTAEHQYKCKFKKIHISTPVNLKKQYTNIFKKIFETAYKIEDIDNIDEGFAVLYNNIRRMNETEKLKALIIDCGGGTTDLAKCEFQKKIGTVNADIYIKNIPAEGDDSFGGDNITKRIMQYMQIIYAHEYRYKDKVSIDNYIKSNSDIFRKVDKDKGVENLYHEFIEEVEKCEKIIPTKYQHHKTDKMEEEYNLILNNYHFLWELAEDMKKQFYLKTSIQRSTFNQENNKDEDSDLNIIIRPKWSLSFYEESGILRKVEDFPKATFTIKEINQLIKGDIYNVVRKLINPLYEGENGDKLSEYKIVNLSGQSCRIEIFKDSLKEFIPGKAFYSENKVIYTEEDYLQLKLSCLEGAINYFKDINEGLIRPIEQVSDAKVPYGITITTIYGETDIIKKGSDFEKAVGYFTKVSGTQTVKLFIKNNEDFVVNTITHEIKTEDYKEIGKTELLTDYPKINQSNHLDSLENKYANFIIYTDIDINGFKILNIKKENGKYYLGECKEYSF